MTPDEVLARVFPARNETDAQHIAQIEAEATNLFLNRCRSELERMEKGIPANPMSGYPGWWGRATTKHRG